MGNMTLAMHLIIISERNKIVKLKSVLTSNDLMILNSMGPNFYIHMKYLAIFKSKS